MKRLVVLAWAAIVCLVGMAGCGSSRLTVPSTATVRDPAVGETSTASQLSGVVASTHFPKMPSTVAPSATLTPTVVLPNSAPTSSPSPTLNLGSLPVISAENIASLQKVGEIRYAPWDLVMAVAWSPGGRWLAVATAEEVHLYEEQSLQEARILEVGKWTVSLAFSQPMGEEKDGSYLALALKEGLVQIWKIPAGQLLCQINAHLKGANSIAFSPDGRFLASTGNDGIVRLWELSPILEGDPCPDRPAAEMIGGAFAVTDIAFSPDGRAVASANARIVHLRDPISQRLIRTLYGENSIFRIAYNPDGKWLAGAEMGGSARIWEVESGELRVVLSGPDEPFSSSGIFLWSVGFSPDGLILAGGRSDGQVILWALSSDPVNRVVLRDHNRAVTSLAFSPDGGRLATGSLDGSVIVWGIP